jgi:hypothetical protein
MKIIANFDRAIAEVLAEKVKARLTFKVCDPSELLGRIERELMEAFTGPS